MAENENQIFWSNLEKIKDVLLFDDVELASSIGLKYEDYFSLSSSKVILPHNAIVEFSEKFNFHIDELFDKNFSFECTENDQQMLIDRYNVATYSFTRPINNILNYLEYSRGVRAKNKLLDDFQLSEKFIKRAKNKTNILLITDIVENLYQTQQFTEKDFLAIGQRMPFLGSSNILKNKLNEHKMAITILEAFIYDCARMFDSNFTYKISSYQNDKAVIDMIPNKHVVDELESDAAFKSINACLTRMGNMSAVTYFRYGRNADIKLIRTLHNGAESIQCQVDLLPFKKMDAMENSESAAGIFYQSKRVLGANILIH